MINNLINYRMASNVINLFALYFLFFFQSVKKIIRVSNELKKQKQINDNIKII